MNPTWFFTHLQPTLGFLLALALLSHILKQRRSPASTLAWLMAILFVPYLGVPLYLMLGGRKMAHMVNAKGRLPSYPQTGPGVDYGVRVLPPGPGSFPPTSGNQARFLRTGVQAYDETLRLIQGAERSIRVATFILGKDETGRAIMEALAVKASQGVRVCLLLDALGSVKITRRFLAPFEKAGVKTAFFMPMVHLPFRGRANLRNHRKMILVDDAAAIMGGMNLAAEYMGPYEETGRWRDLSVLLRGPVVAHLNEIFRSDWKFAAHEDLPPAEPAAVAAAGSRDVLLQTIASGPDVTEDSLREAILAMVFKAARRVWIVTPYFVPDDLLAEALCMAARRGVDIRLLVPRRSNHRLADLARASYLTQLREAGARVCLYQAGMLHAKALLVDDDVAVVGSANMDMRSLLLNYEVALCVYFPGFVREVDRWMCALMKDCSFREPRRSAPVELIEGVGRLFAPLL